MNDLCRDYPILEYDPAPEAIIEPRRIIQPRDIPPRCVLTFFQDVITTLREQGRLQEVGQCRSELCTHPIYRLELDGQLLIVAHPGVGAPYAAAILDELIAMGAHRFIACGGAGVLDREIAVGHIIVPVAAVRDEGTSYHYLPPGREVAASAAGIVAIEQVLRRHDLPYILAKTWTTDAIYRETPDKVHLRQSEGCVTVEMEAAAFFAVAQFRGVTFGQLLYGGDDVSGAVWDAREWQTRGSARERLFWLAAEACLEL